MSAFSPVLVMEIEELDDDEFAAFVECLGPHDERRLRDASEKCSGRMDAIETAKWRQRIKTAKRMVEEYRARSGR